MSVFSSSQLLLSHHARTGQDLQLTTTIERESRGRNGRGVGSAGIPPPGCRESKTESGQESEFVQMHCGKACWKKRRKKVSLCEDR